MFSPSAEDRGDGTDTAGGSNAAGSGGGQRSIGSPVERQETYGDMERVSFLTILYQNCIQSIRYQSQAQ